MGKIMISEGGAFKIPFPDSNWVQSVRVPGAELSSRVRAKYAYYKRFCSKWPRTLGVGQSGRIRSAALRGGLPRLRPHLRHYVDQAHRRRMETRLFIQRHALPAHECVRGQGALRTAQQFQCRTALTRTQRGGRGHLQVRRHLRAREVPLPHLHQAVHPQ
ncbi:hypothetical protein NPIL_227321 [Nephila pilipes]|uniref:Uncharacterized protein n=1 Tax=Nephila pilipes TaxID=299642 RepID=A0A8X6KJT1_NEPPI|nr:hypothetical protein NPIL_227321 [Nephila pilipes]